MTQAPIATPKPAIERSPELSAPPPRRKKSSGSPLRFGLVLIVLAVVVVAVAIRLMNGGGGASVSNELLFTVARGELLIDVTESGSLESGNSIDIKSELEGRPQILRIVDEGTFVTKGELLCELDASDLVERETAQEISYEKALASYIAAQKNHEINKSNGESDIKQGELDVFFAEIDFKKYEKGDWPQRLQQAKANITIAEEELKRANDKEEWSEKLEAKGFITKQELEADQLAVTKRSIELELTNRDLEVLEQYTYEKDHETFKSNLEEAKKQLDRIRARVEREFTLSEADLKSKKATHELEEERLAKHRDQIAKSKIIAPQDGLVVYANSSGGMGRSNQEPIQEGSTVRERQTIFKLPDVTNMIAKIKIHESSYDRVSEGLKALVTLDAFPDRVFAGRVMFVAPLPDSQQWWMNPDLKVYTAEVRLGGDTTMLKPGMSCSVDIQVDLLDDAVHVPIQSVFREGSTAFCYAQTSSGVVAKPVRTGLHNDRLIHIIDGLEEGDRVFLAPPQNADEVEVPESEAPMSDRPGEDAFPDYEPGKRRAGGSDGEALTYEDYQKLPDSEKMSAAMRLSPEDRQKAMRAAMEKMTPEQRERMQQMMSGGGAPGGGSGGDRSGMQRGGGGDRERGEGDRPGGEGRRPGGEGRRGGRPGGGE